jgi:hypothetical protein
METCLGVVFKQHAPVSAKGRKTYETGSVVTHMNIQDGMAMAR